MAAELKLELLGEKALHQAANPRLLAYCPSMDLLALGSTDQQVLIYRLNGQRVSVATQGRSSPSVEKIGWKPNGQLLAIAWRDGNVRLVGAESSKTVHQILTDASAITCLGWTSNRSSKNPRAGLWKDALEEALGDYKEQNLLDLPRDLTLIDIESSLPKLSVLPAGATSEDIFSSRASLDGLFHHFDPAGNDAVDVMVIGTSDGGVHLSIYDSFIVGLFGSPLGSSHSSYQLIQHASHQYYSTHALLMKSKSAGMENLCFVPMDLRFISASSGYLSLLASRSTALQNLLRYINEVQILMRAEWQATQDLPRRFLRNINEALGKNGYNIVQAMYHSVATGHTFPAVREWLVDELAERGHKRWDKTVVTGLDNIRRLVHENMMPALERCSLILSRLGGIAKFQGSSDGMGFSYHQISLVMDTIVCLNLVSARILTYVIEELNMFRSFSTWLRHEIDRLASDASSSPSDDMVDKEAAIDHNKVLLYIQSAMTTSRLAIFFQDAATEGYERDWESAEQGIPMYELLDKQLQKYDSGLPYLEGVTNVELLCRYLGRQATTVFRQIAENEKRNVLFGEPIAIGVTSGGMIQAMRVCPVDDNHCRTYIAVVSVEGPNIIRIFSIQLRIENGVSSRSDMVEAPVNLGNGVVKDLTFLDKNQLLVLWFPKDEPPLLLSIPYQENNTAISYCSAPTDRKASSKQIQAQHISPDLLKHCTKYSFPESNVNSFVPEKIETAEEKAHKGSHNWKEDAARVCVLDATHSQYMVFAIPYSANMTHHKPEDGNEGGDSQVTQE